LQSAKIERYVVRLATDYKQPLVSGTNLTTLTAESACLLYRDRWPVEQLPLAAKQMLGLHRQFVFANETCFRLPEFSLITGALLTDPAAVLPPIPSGFWDRSPEATHFALGCSAVKSCFSMFSATGSLCLLSVVQ